MEIADAETEVGGVARNAARLRLTLEHDDARHAAAAQLDRRREPRWPAADDHDVGVVGHCAPRSSATVRPLAAATRRVTAAAQ